MKLIQGNKYTINFEWGSVQAFYAGSCDSLNGQRCSCCDKECNRGHIFYVPTNDNTTYSECEGGSYTDYLPVGNTCIKALDIKLV